jgi:iron complex outermembrane receptor protein
MKILSLKISMRPHLLCGLWLSYLWSAGVNGQETGPAEAPIYELSEFTVVAERYSEIGDFSILYVDILDAADMERMAQATLGETLAWEPGISASYFGPGASRPVIRGLGDYRVRMLLDDIGTLDVSDNSPDHGVPLEPLLVRKVEVFRGPSALLFGNAAVGGAINSQTRYLPEALPVATVEATGETRFSSVDQGWASSGYITVGAGDFALRATASDRQSEDYSIAGQARTEKYEQTFQPIVNDPGAGVSVPIENPSGTLPNTHHEAQTKSLGLLWAPEKNPLDIGIAYSRYDSAYGVPYQFGGDANDLFGDTSLNMEQERVDLSLEVETELSWLPRIRLRAGGADYAHEETFTGRLKDADKQFADTRMALESGEARLDFYHEIPGGFEGVAGVHGFTRELRASRLSAPPVEASRVGNLFETDNIGFFLVETYTVGDWTLQGGYRYEDQKILDRSAEQFGFTREAVASSQSAALGITWRKYQIAALDELALSLNLSNIERLPSETERFAFWSNPAIQRFIIGADNTGAPLEVETARGIEIGAEAHRGNVSARLNIYQYEYDDFIFLQDIRGIGNLALYVAKDTRFRGAEAEVTWLAWQHHSQSLRIKGMADVVRGENLEDDTHLPRIPLMRLGSRIEYADDRLQLGAEYRYAFAQERVQQASAVVLPELETDAYAELNLDAEYSIEQGALQLTLFARATNLLDAERRSHTSFLKDVAPLPGRNLSIGLRAAY